ncbi:VWA domain-containing protein [Pseudalkalibacillus sp. Hm43]|uniref:VWA domain-containing protein n=1 Tax=Pseudalkalibacillus sp. Hm43 TaxID=3450742 RepID=UPI003F432F5A
MKRAYSIISLILLVVFITACSNDSSGEASKEKEKPKEKQEETFDYPEAATDAEGIIEQGAGKYTEVIFEEDEDQIDTQKLEEDFVKELKDLPSDVSTEQIYDFMIANGAFPYQKVNQQYDDFDPTYLVNAAEGEQKKPKNIVFLLDASGSMAGQVTGGVKMDLAKSALKRAASNLDPSTKVALRVYGHKGSNADSDKKVSCDSSEMVYPLNTYNEENFQTALSKFKPTGWTPIASSLQLAKDDFKGANGNEVENIIYVISDGVETCDGDPVQAAKEIHESDLNITVNVIGFNLNQEGKKQLKATAQAGGGKYKDVNSQADLQQSLQEFVDEVKAGIYRDLDNVKEGININTWYLDQSNKLRKINDNFSVFAKKEYNLLTGFLDGIEDEGKLKEGMYSDLRDMIYQRSETMKEYSQKRHDELEKELEEAHKQAQKELDEKQKNN